jgi:hypothetical protein
MVDAPPVAPWIPGGFPSVVRAFIHEEPILSALSRRVSPAPNRRISVARFALARMQNSSLFVPQLVEHRLDLGVRQVAEIGI